ncbi:Fatty acid desaturase domain containing protein [Rhypophila decipiens]
MKLQHGEIVFDAGLTRPDRLVLEQLCRDASSPTAIDTASTKATIDTLKALNNPNDAQFDPTVFTTWDLDDVRSSSRVPGFVLRLLEEYISWARRVVRVETDVVMVTHLLLYFCTSIPSAILLFTRFSYLHAVGHLAMQGYYMGPYTLLKHQHIHMRGVLAKRFSLVDNLFPYAMDLLMGHTWNSYYYHHVKHHHVEGNGPFDLSSTIRYQRDSAADFAMYVGRFLAMVWFDLPRYFFQKKQLALGLKTLGWELSSYVAIYLAFQINARAATFVFLLPLCCMRVALMVGNWGQHAFVDEDEPDSDFRSSITLIDVASNRFCYNDGYHTSHHLNPLRHWRDHPSAFLQAKPEYARQQALVFHDIDYIFITIYLLKRDYEHLARCLVPIGEKQLAMTLEDRVAMLKRHTRKFTEEEIRKKFKLPSQ